MIGAFNSASFDLYKEIIKDSTQENLIFSPYCINSAMSMVLAGAEGETAKEIQKALNYISSIDIVEAALVKLSNNLSKMNNSENVLYSSVNGIALVQPHLILKNYVSKLKSVYNANVFNTNDIHVINSWVKNQTSGKIDGILKELPIDTAAVILNAVYFKGIWKSKFIRKDTKEDKFHVSSNESLVVPLMNQKDKFPFVKKEKYKSIAMDYDGGRVSMLAVLPNEGFNLSTIEQEFDWDDLHELALDLRIRRMNIITDDEKSIKEYKKWITRSAPRTVKVTFPKFKLDSELSLNKVFLKLGVVQAFSDINANFSKMHGRKNDIGFLKIGEIRHKSMIEVNEEGSEAAASTAVRVDSRSFPIIETFKANRPFLYFIIDKETNLILFMGKVVRPI